MSKQTKIKSKKKSIQRHNRLVRKKMDIKEFKRRHSGGAKGCFVYSNNFLSRLRRELGDDVVQLKTVSSITHELKEELAMEKPTDSVKYLIPQYVSEE